MRALVALLPLAAGCFFGDDHGHGGHGKERVREELPAEVTAENAASVFEKSLRRAGASGVGEGVVFRPWRKTVEGKDVLAGIERHATRGSWTRIDFLRIRKVKVTPPAQGGLKLWELTLEGESLLGSGDSPVGETSTPFSLWSADGDAVKALAASVELLRTKR